MGAKKTCGGWGCFGRLRSPGCPGSARQPEWDRARGQPLRDVIAAPGRFLSDEEGSRRTGESRPQRAAQLLPETFCGGENLPGWIAPHGAERPPATAAAFTDDPLTPGDLPKGSPRPDSAKLHGDGDTLGLFSSGARAQPASAAHAKARAAVPGPGRSSRGSGRAHGQGGCVPAFLSAGGRPAMSAAMSAWVVTRPHPPSPEPRLTSFNSL